MQPRFTRRCFLRSSVAVAAATSFPGLADEPDPPRARVAIARDPLLARDEPAKQAELVRKLLDAALQRLTEAADAASAWRRLFQPGERIGIKVNTLGFATRPVVADAIVAGLRSADVPAERIVIWDRCDVELGKAGFKLSKSGGGVQCRGTDAERAGRGYQQNVETQGQIGSCFSRILAEEVDALISVPVLKDHNLAGVSLGMKNFYGAIHNPNKYHDHNCDPFIVDVVSHPFIAKKWRLTICDGLRGQCHGGPGVSPGFVWPFGGLVVGTDFVAADAVAAEIIQKERQARGLKSLAEDGRPPRHIATAGARGFGQADLARIQQLDV